MKFNREQDVCHGRGFNEGHVNEGYLENFHDWVTRAIVGPGVPVSKSVGGPEWLIIEDQSAASPDPYIVISNHTIANLATGGDPASAGPNRYDEPHKILKLQAVTSEAGLIWVECYLWWDVPNKEGYGLIGAHSISTLDDADFVYDFRGGPEMMIIQSRIGTDWDSVVLAEWTGDANLVPGTHVVGVLQSGITAGASKTLQLDSGQAQYFEEGKWYWIYNAEGDGTTYNRAISGVVGGVDIGLSWVNYVEVTSVNTYNDTIVIGACDKNFPADSVIAGYVHRYVFSGNNTSASTGRSTYKCNMPYMSRYQNEMWNPQSGGRIYGAVGGDVMKGYLGEGGTASVTPGMAPNDEGRFACQRPGLYERIYHQGALATDMNRGYGPMSQVYGTCLNNMLANNDGRRINNLNYLYFQTMSDVFYLSSTQQAAVFPDFDSAT